MDTKYLMVDVSNPRVVNFLTEPPYNPGELLGTPHRIVHTFEECVEYEKNHPELEIHFVELRKRP